MANSLCFASVNSLNSPSKSGPLVVASSVPKVVLINYSAIRSSRTAKSHSFVVKAAESSSSSGTKPRSIVCADCDGNGAVLCSQCKGNGVNSVDHFNGQFKAGALCWLCRGKKDILCGNCNGAGFLGGFMSTFDE